jgi:hypothetical protein
MKLLAAILTHPGGVVATDHTTSEDNVSSLDLFFEPVIKPGQPIFNVSDFLVAAERTNSRFFREFDSLGLIHITPPLSLELAIVYGAPQAGAP